MARSYDPDGRRDLGDEDDRCCRTRDAYAIAAANAVISSLDIKPDA